MRPKDTQAAKTDRTIDDEIGDLSDKEAIFILRTLLLVSHVSERTMTAAIDLARSVRHD